MAKSLRSPDHLALISVLRRARDTAGLTQQQVAAALSRPQSYVAKVEVGERRLDVVEFIELARVLGHSPETLIGEVERLKGRG
jgi:transcriptional regulator with XRE-family HTH domain